MSDLTIVGWCSYIRNGEAVGMRTTPSNGDFALVLLSDATDEIERLRTELERTRQAWVNGDDPMCDDVCVIECKGPCGATS